MSRVTPIPSTHQIQAALRCVSLNYPAIQGSYLPIVEPAVCVCSLYLSVCLYVPICMYLTASVVWWLAFEDYKHRGPGFDSRALLRIFLRELGLERGPLSLVIG
jgi:hypothetical protein